VSKAAAEAYIRGAAHESRAGNLLRGREAPDARSEVRNREHPRGIPALTSVLLHWFAKRLHLEPGTPPLVALPQSPFVAACRHFYVGIDVCPYQERPDGHHAIAVQRGAYDAGGRGAGRDL